MANEFYSHSLDPDVFIIHLYLLCLNISLSTIFLLCPYHLEGINKGTLSIFLISVWFWDLPLLVSVHCVLIKQIIWVNIIHYVVIYKVLYTIYLSINFCVFLFGLFEFIWRIYHDLNCFFYREDAYILV